jgi:hypothetical protein
LVKLSDCYKLWHVNFNDTPRLTRYTIGTKIDQYFTECIEDCLLAAYTPRDQKLRLLETLSCHIDALKFFLKLLWEIKGLKNSAYAPLSQQLSEIGKMVGGWINTLKRELPRQ